MEILKESLISVGFKNIHVDYEIIKVEFADVMDLLKWVKGIGANVLNDDVSLGRQGIQNIEKYYKAQYPYSNGICATFEVVWVLAERK